MAVKRERSAEHLELPNVTAFADARWFAGKGRVVTVLRPRAASPDGAAGASVAFVDVEYESGEREQYALALREGRECAGDDPLWAALARFAGAEPDPGRARFLAGDLSNTVVSLDDRLVLKLFRLLERGRHPEAELLQALDGFAQVPALVGVVEHDGMAVAIVEEFVDGTPVGWEGLIGRLAAGENAIGDAAELGRVAGAIKSKAHGRWRAIAPAERPRRRPAPIGSHPPRGARVAADAAETGDWLHVDVYLSKRPSYAAILFAGSRFDAGVLEWSAKRTFPVVAVGPPVTGAAVEVAYPAAGSSFVPCSSRPAWRNSSPRSSGSAASSRRLRTRRSESVQPTEEPLYEPDSSSGSFETGTAV
jgi:hypothetical protein